MSREDILEPARFARLLLNLFFPKDRRITILCELDDAFAVIADKNGMFRANIWFIIQALKIINGKIINQIYWSGLMFKSYLVLTFRNLGRYKGYSLITIAGLMVGMTCSILILLWVWDESSYDRHHDKADRIYRVVMGIKEPLALTAAPLANTFMETYPEVECATRFRDFGTFIVSIGDKHLTESDVLFADPEIFNIFTIPFIKGDPVSALTEPYTVVLTERVAEKLFGYRDPLNEMIRFDDHETLFRVTGVVEDAPINSHFHYTLIASLITREDSRSTFWGNNNHYTFILLREGIDPASLETKFPDLVRTHVAPQLEELLGYSFETFLEAGNSWTYRLQPLRDIHLHSQLLYEFESNGDMKTVYLFTAVAIFIMIIAGINFMNLTTARSGNRANEVGIRKVLGSSRYQLIPQFLYESVIISFIALLFSMLIVHMLLPSFNTLTAKQLTTTVILNPAGVVLVLGLTILIGILAGCYPAFCLSSFRPIVVLRGRQSSVTKKSTFRNVLVVFQFTITIIILIGTFAVHRQVNYMRERNLGFYKDQTLVLQWIYQPEGHRQTFLDLLKTHSDVLHASFSTFYPGSSQFSYNTHRVEGRMQMEGVECHTIWADYDFAETLGLRMSIGRYFSRSISSDTSAIVINEAAVRALGLDDPIGKRLMGGDKYVPERVIPKKIIGVVEDFHFASLHQEIKPFLIEFMPEPWWGNALVRMRSDNITETIAFTGKTYENFSPGQEFQYSFLDDEFDGMYRSELRTGKIFAIFTGLAIFIACMGLFGLMTYATQKRIKEIGVRKVLGASEVQIVFLLCREVIILVLASIAPASFIAYFVINNWLQNFAYRIGLDMWTFVWAGFLALFTALFTVGYQSMKAALANPVKSLRYE